MQVVHYGIGGYFKPHYDPCNDTKEVCKRMEGKSGKRFCTVLIYLNDVEVAPRGSKTLTMQVLCYSFTIDNQARGRDSLSKVSLVHLLLQSRRGVQFKPKRGKAIAFFSTDLKVDAALIW